MFIAIGIVASFNEHYIMFFLVLFWQVGICVLACIEHYGKLFASKQLLLTTLGLGNEIMQLETARSFLCY